MLGQRAVRSSLVLFLANNREMLDPCLLKVHSATTKPISSFRNFQRMSVSSFFCPTCGKPFMSGEKFCTSCGTLLTPQTPRPSASLGYEEPQESHRESLTPQTNLPNNIFAAGQVAGS